jgi:hypothetical protein
VIEEACERPCAVVKESQYTGDRLDFTTNKTFAAHTGIGQAISDGLSGKLTAVSAGSHKPNAPVAINPVETVETAVAFSDADVKQIIIASQNNEMRFDRDYKGKSFSAAGTFDLASKSLMSKTEYRIEVLVAGKPVDCFTEDPSILHSVVDWQKGQKVHIDGIIGRTTLGTLILDSGCRVDSVD